MCASGCMDLVPKQQNHGGFSAFHCVISFSHAHYVGKQKSREETLIRRSRIESGIYSSWPHICCHCRNNFPVSWVFCAQNCNTEKLFSGRKHSSCEAKKSNGMKCHVIGAVLLRWNGLCTFWSFNWKLLLKKSSLICKAIWKKMTVSIFVSHAPCWSFNKTLKN